MKISGIFSDNLVEFWCDDVRILVSVFSATISLEIDYGIDILISDALILCV
jgi:hypothetical protein